MKISHIKFEKKNLLFFFLRYGKNPRFILRYKLEKIKNIQFPSYFENNKFYNEKYLFFSCNQIFAYLVILQLLKSTIFNISSISV